MTVVRRLIAQRHLAALLCAAALLLRLAVPTGYMVATDRGRIAITVCPGSAAPAMTAMRHGGHGHDRSGDHGRAEMPCAFSGLSAAALAAIDAVALAVPPARAVAPALAVAAPPAPPGPSDLRPPPRGPPAAG